MESYILAISQFFVVKVTKFLFRFRWYKEYIKIYFFTNLPGCGLEMNKRVGGIEANCLHQRTA